jgi:hypothetical protein
VPVLGSAVAVVVIGAIGLVFYPRISRWFGPDRESVSAVAASPTAKVPVWVCRSVEGVALLLDCGPQENARERLDGALTREGLFLIRLEVFNFAREAPFVLTLKGAGLASPEGGPRARPASSALRAGLSDPERAILRGMGAVDSLEVAKGHRGQALLVLATDPALRTSFATGELIFERREVERRTLAAWRQEPDLKEFQDF